VNLSEHFIWPPKTWRLPQNGHWSAVVIEGH